MNNKGMTLTELMVSITMLSIAVVLMYGLMSNLQKKKNAVDIRADELIKIADIEKAFQKKVLSQSDYGRKKVYKCNSTTDLVNYNSSKLTVAYKTTGSCNKYELSINDNVILLKDLINTSRQWKWTMKKDCSFLDASKEEDNVSNTYNYVIKCYKNKAADYIKFPIYFSLVG